MTIKMLRPKQIITVSVLGALCTVIYMSMSRSEPGPTVPSLQGLARLENLIQQSQSLAGYIDDVKSTIHSDVTIEEEMDVVVVAKKISSYNRTVLVTMVNDAYLSFTYSWLCNTKDMGIHKSVLFITTDKSSKEKLNRDWPEVSVIAMNMETSKGDQVYSQVGYVKIMVKRTEMLLSILMANVEIFLFEVDCLWLANPVPELQKLQGYDILVNPVSNTNGKTFAGGFLWLYTTDKAKALWKQLTAEMIALGERIEHKASNAAVSEAENDQAFFSRLINERYANVSVKVLPLDIYADGKWYSLPERQRVQSHPIVINNNWVLGNKAKIDRAKQWKHWFIRDDFSCDMELVKQVVY